MEPRPLVTVPHCPFVVNIGTATAAFDGGLVMGWRVGGSNT